MTTKPFNQAKAIDKSLFKYKGKLKHVEIISDKLIQFILYKGSLKDNRLICFICADKKIIERMQTSSPRSRHSVKFRINCKEVSAGKYYNNLWAVSVEDWIAKSKKDTPNNNQQSMFGSTSWGH